MRKKLAVSLGNAQSGRVATEALNVDFMTSIPISPHTIFMTLCSSLQFIPVFSCSTIIFFYLVPFLSFPLPGTLVAMGTMMLILRVEFREAHKHRGEAI